MSAAPANQAAAIEAKIEALLELHGIERDDAASKVVLVMTPDGGVTPMLLEHAVNWERSQRALEAARRAGDRLRVDISKILTDMAVESQELAATFAFDDGALAPVRKTWPAPKSRRRR